MLDYRSRLLIPEIRPAAVDAVPLFTGTGLQIAADYTRIVINIDRGPYVEFCSDQILRDNLLASQPQWGFIRLGTPNAREWRSNDEAWVEVLHQIQSVKTYDLKAGMWYASPFDLRQANGADCILPKPEQQLSLFA